MPSYLAAQVRVAPVSGKCCMSRISVLVVEDEALIRMSIADQLERMDFIVHEAANADEAIAFLQRRNDIRFVFTDVQMPGTMDGIQLAHYVRKRWPPTAIVICSADKPPEVSKLPSNAYWLAKPFNPETFGVAINVATRWIT